MELVELIHLYSEHCNFVQVGIKYTDKESSLAFGYIMRH